MARLDQQNLEKQGLPQMGGLRSLSKIVNRLRQAVVAGGGGGTPTYYYSNGGDPGVDGDNSGGGRVYWQHITVGQSGTATKIGVSLYNAPGDLIKIALYDNAGTPVL